MRPPPPQLTFRQSMEATDLLIAIINLVVQDDAVAMELALTILRAWKAAEQGLDAAHP